MFTKESAQVSTATATDEEKVIAALTLAFSADPALRWMYPQSQQYLTYFPHFARKFAGKAFDKDTAYHTAGYAGAALWLPPESEADEEPLVALLQESVLDSQLEEVFAIFEQMGNYHPQQPHWYLSLLGVEPMQQGKGNGSALMQQILPKCDRDRLPAYLESSNSASVPFYQHYGFEVLAQIQIGTSPTIFPMLRCPHN
ncbi:MAG: GNAT family N-acetyltransferase [Spirulinaceae cyanobacterium]